MMRSPSGLACLRSLGSIFAQPGTLRATRLQAQRAELLQEALPGLGDEAAVNGRASSERQREAADQAAAAQEAPTLPHPSRDGASRNARGRSRAVNLDTL